MEFPKYKYHAELEPMVVDDESEESMLGEDWANSPAEHGIITQPSKDQAHKIKLEALAKEAKRKPGRPAKEE